MQRYDYRDIGEFINIGVGEDLTIKDLAMRISRIVGFEGKMVWDTSKPDGMQRKVLDASRIRSLGWKHRIELEQGLEMAYRWFVQNLDHDKR
jgi:GDP-L-fucose synthase